MSGLSAQRLFVRHICTTLIPEDEMASTIRRRLVNELSEACRLAQLATPRDRPRVRVNSRQREGESRARGLDARSDRERTPATNRRPPASRSRSMSPLCDCRPPPAHWDRLLLRPDRGEAVPVGLDLVEVVTLAGVQVVLLLVVV